MDRRLTQRGIARKRQLMAFAAARFADHGYHPTSVAEIVKGLGVGKGVFYWYFSSKEELFLEILRDAQQDLRRRQKAAINDLDDPMLRIEHGIRASMHWSAEHRDLANLFLFAVTEERFAHSLRKGQEVAVADAVHHVKDAIAEGKVPDADPVMLAHAILGVTKEFARTFIHERGEDSEAVATAAVEFCLGGLLGRRNLRDC
jgi:AcrR family transcriptional regulator